MGVPPIGAVPGGILGGLLGVRETLLVVTIAQLAGLLFLVRSPSRLFGTCPSRGTDPGQACDRAPSLEPAR